MRTTAPIFCLGIIFLLLGACGSDLKVENETDPLLQSFWRKGISSMIEKKSKDSLVNFNEELIELSSFDQNGNIVEERHLVNGESALGFRKFAYNDQHFLTRLLLVSDGFVHESYKYDF